MSACSPRISRQTTEPARLKPLGDSEIENVPVTLPAEFRPASKANVRVYPEPMLLVPLPLTVPISDEPFTIVTWPYDRFRGNSGAADEQSGGCMLVGPSNAAVSSDPF